MPYTDFHYVPTGTGVISGKEVLEQTEDAINDLGQQTAAGVDQAIDTANNALNTANTASADAQNAVNTANTAYTTATNAQNTANTAQTTATNAQNAATAAQNDVDALGNRVTTAENNIAQNTSDISGLTTRMGTAEGNITTLQNDVVTAQGTATSAQNTATLARGQAYVVRYANVAVSDNSTVPYTDLNNTDNIKANDLLLDTNGKFYQITSVDSANETVSVTTPLTQLAVDANVMHLSGNETASGTKDFADNLRIYNSNTSANTARLELKNSKVNRGQAVFGDQVIWFRDATDKPITALISRVSGGASAFLIFAYNIDQNNQQVSNYLSFVKNLDGSCFLLPDQNDVIELGGSVAKFKNLNTNKINGLEPSSLSMPVDRGSRIDISGSFTNTGSGQSNSYTASANGYIYLNLSSVSKIISVSETSGGLANYANTTGGGGADGQFYVLFPIRKNDVYRCIWYTSSTVTVSNAYFIPCQGNV